MPGSDEKARLVPVLSTILKLSPAEVETIQKTINGKKITFPVHRYNNTEFILIKIIGTYIS